MTTAMRSFPPPDSATDDIARDYVTPAEAAEKLGLSTWSVQAKCRAYRKRILGIQAEGRQPTAVERQAHIPSEMECVWLGHERARTGPPIYLVKRSQLNDFPVNRPGSPAGERPGGRPAGSGRGQPLQRHVPREQDRRYKENRHLPPREKPDAEN